MNERKNLKPSRLWNQLHCRARDYVIRDNGECRALELWTLFIFVIALCAFAIFHEITAIGD